MRYSFGIEKLRKHLAISAGQNQKVYLDFFGPTVNSVILLLLRPSMVAFFIISTFNTIITLVNNAFF
jgi:hypothetical protein